MVKTNNLILLSPRRLTAVRNLAVNRCLLILINLERAPHRNLERDSQEIPSNLHPTACDSQGNP